VYTPDPDFEAMKAVTRLMWLLDVSPLSAPQEREAAAGPNGANLGAL
jgi:hypothetical protein